MSQIGSNIGSEYGYDIGFVKHENEETNIGFVNHDNEETNGGDFQRNNNPWQWQQCSMVFSNNCTTHEMMFSSESKGKLMPGTRRV